MLFSEKDLKVVPHNDKTYRLFRPYSVSQLKNVVSRWYDTPQLRPINRGATLEAYNNEKLKKQDIVDLILSHDWSQGFKAVQIAYLETRGHAMNRRPKKWTVLKALSNDGKLRLNQEPSTIQSQLDSFLSEFYDCYLYTYYEKKTRLYWTRVQLSPIDKVEVSARANVTSVGYMIYNPAVEYMLYTGKLYTADLRSLKEATLEVFNGDKLMVQTLNSDVVQYLQHVVDGRTSKQLAPLLLHQQQLQLQAEYDEDDDDDNVDEEGNGEGAANKRLKLVNNSLSANPLDIRQRQDPALSLLHNNDWEFENSAERLVRERQKRLKNVTQQKEHKEQIRGALQVLGLGKFYSITELEIDVQLPFQYDDTATRQRQRQQGGEAGFASAENQDHSRLDTPTNDNKPALRFRMEMKGGNIPRGVRDLIEMGKIGPQMPSWLTSNVGYTNATKLRVTRDGVKELNGLEDEEDEKEQDNDKEDGDKMEEDRFEEPASINEGQSKGDIEEMDIEQTASPRSPTIDDKGTANAEQSENLVNDDDNSVMNDS